MFIHKVFWQNYSTETCIDISLLDSTSRRAIATYYQDNQSLARLFLEILAVEYKPTIDDYLPLISKTNDLDQIWKLIIILTRLAAEQKKEIELQGRNCLEFSL